MKSLEIAKKFDLLAKLMELHNHNTFKIKSYANAYLILKKIDKNIDLSNINDLEGYAGLGKSIIEKTRELLSTGTLNALEELYSMTPDGVIEMLSIRGLGPKKVQVIWKEMDIKTVGELIYACSENRLVNYTGFGVKTQSEIEEKAKYFLQSKNSYLFAHVIDISDELINLLHVRLPQESFLISGDVYRKMPVVNSIDIITNAKDDEILQLLPEISIQEESKYYRGILIRFINSDNPYKTQFDHSLSADFHAMLNIPEQKYASEKEIFKTIKLPYIPQECREFSEALEWFKNPDYQLIEAKNIQGVIHAHSTYSDGLHTLEEMSMYAQKLGYKYLAITDHSKAAGYAQGLNEENVMRQWEEIDGLNIKYKKDDFQILKGIEADILSNGELDYSDAFNKGFDLIIASVHSVLNMDEKTATQRIIRAVENPRTHILGHPSGRLLLSRKGYPLDYRKVIDACASNGVAIEINANPQRLDLDWTWVKIAKDKGVKIAINPDAHHMHAIDYIKYGVIMARKAGLETTDCINCLPLDELWAWLKRK